MKKKLTLTTLLSLMVLTLLLAAFTGEKLLDENNEGVITANIVEKTDIVNN
ncbi:hypothetical protein [Miniphocaeibacter massiliensis]|uniref:hypothetical protein n=1 Tax=Miniphocaeibacter massiliensis TaxID=2041841 RepID=UPI0013EBFFA4|nr:hypothetical protein [Miniphocaeibacter massiliensis]